MLTLLINFDRKERQNEPPPRSDRFDVGATMIVRLTYGASQAASRSGFREDFEFVTSLRYQKTQ